MVVVGLNSDWESEGFDRPTLDLPGKQDELVAAVASVNPRTVVVIQAVSLIYIIESVHLFYIVIIRDPLYPCLGTILSLRSFKRGYLGTKSVMR